MKLFILMMLVLPQVQSTACDCRLATVADAFQRTEAIFYGKHLGTKYTTDYYSMTGRPLKVDNFEVIKGFKGVDTDQFEPLAGKKYIVSVLSPCDQSSCQQCFEPNKYYLVYGSVNPYSGAFGVEYCSRSREIVASNFMISEQYDRERGKDEQHELLRLSKTNGAAGESFFTILEKKDQEIDSLGKENSRLQNRLRRIEIVLYGLSILMLVGIFFFVQKR